MTVYQRIFIVLLLVVISTCYGYQLYRDSSSPIRPIKYHILTEPDRHADRMKQYHDTVAQLRLWRRYIDEFVDDDGVNEYFHQSKSSGNFKH